MGNEHDQATLCALRVGQCATIRAIGVPVGARGARGVEHVADDALLERRLLELGFFAGARVEVVATMWPDDDPLAVRIGGANFALRRHEAALVQVDVAARDTGPDA
jgi:ferrous iron transport protein A